MAAPESETPESNPLEELLRKMLPEGAPLPDEDELDYSISFDYIGPSPFYKPPIKSTVPKPKFTAFPKQVPSLSPKNSAWLKSRSSSDATNSDDKWFSASSMVLEYGTDDNTTIVDDNHEDRDNSDYVNEGREDRIRECCVLSIGNKARDCSRCGKGGNGLLRGRVGCIVCGEVYCKKCVMKAMGTMPEGRKCVGCIGKPIDERNRGRLGKGSRFLARMCDDSEVKRIMRAERECKANQVRPEQVVVNGKQLKVEELVELLGCALPPRDLRPGRYWYDKDSGLWGKVDFL